MNNEIKYVSPFKRFCITVGNLPTAYLESMSYYEGLTYLVNYLSNNVIPALNNNSAVVEELQEQFTILKNYVDNYFDNLDVQQEINNKLDEMAESGELTDIIAQYLGLAGLLVYNTVSDMKTAENISNGSKCMTFGYYTANDGGHAYYRVRPILNTDVIDEKFIISLYNVNLIAELITDAEINIRQIGANEEQTDNSLYINASLNKLNYAIIPDGEFNCSTQIILKNKQSLYGNDKTKCILNCTSNIDFIISEDLPTTQFISVHDLTINGNNKTGKGIYFLRTTKQSDTWHRLYNLRITNFEYGLYLSKHLNEIQVSDVVTSYNMNGIYITYLNDYYLERCVSNVNTKYGIYLYNSTEGRISDTKSWYNGSDDPTTFYNVWLSSCTALMVNNLTCQESYGSNLFVGASQYLSFTNTYLSLPALNTDATRYQFVLEATNKSNFEILCDNRYENDTYINNTLSINGNCYENKINIIVEDDYPDAKMMIQKDNANRYNVCLKNQIEIKNKTIEYNKDINYAINGDMRYTTDITNFITQGQNYCTIVNGKLRITAPADKDATVTFRYPVLPRTGAYVSYVKFKKVSGTGRVTIDYSGYVDVGASTDTTTDLYASYMRIKTSTASATNQQIKVAKGLTIDISEFGLVNGITAKEGNPLYHKSIVNV